MREPIKFSEHDGRITLVMSRNDWNTLLLLMGIAVGTEMRAGNMAGSYSLLEFVNRLNADNPNFTPYKIPTEVV